jgi:hypothetical protein
MSMVLFAKCNVCGKDFGSRKEIRTHLKVKHKVTGGKAKANEVAITGESKRTPLSKAYTRL